MKTPTINNEQKQSFVERLTDKYGKRCKLDGTQPSISDLARYIVAKGVITDISIKEFIFVQDYAEYLARHGQKTKAIEALCYDLDMSRKHGFYLVRSSKFKQMR